MNKITKILTSLDMMKDDHMRKKEQRRREYMEAMESIAKGKVELPDLFDKKLTHEINKINDARERNKK